MPTTIALVVVGRCRPSPDRVPLGAPSDRDGGSLVASGLSAVVGEGLLPALGAPLRGTGRVDGVASAHSRTPKHTHTQSNPNSYPPRGSAPESETVTLLNASPDPVDLTGWRIVDRLGHGGTVPPGPLAAGATLLVRLTDGAQLGNHGGEITLLGADGTKAHGVSYTAEAAGREGWTVVF